MATKYENATYIKVDLADAAFVISSTMKRLGWENLYVNEVLSTITGHISRRMTMSGLNWAFDFYMTVRWMQEDMVIRVDTTVEERTYSHSQVECSKFYKAFEEALEQDALMAQKSPRVKQDGARWATVADLDKAGYLGPLEDHGQLIIARPHEDSEDWIRLPAEATNRHALVCGPTGSGKTTGVFIPNLIERSKCSAIVTEATGARGVADLFQKTSGFRKLCGHKIYYFNPDDMSSSRINPLDRVNTIRQAFRVVEIIMQTTTMASHKGDQSWELSERLLLAALIMHVIGERKNGKANLGYVAELLEEGSEALEEIIGRSSVPFARRFYNTFWKNSTDKYRNLVAAGLVTRLKVFYYPTIRELTSSTDIPFNNLHQQLFTLYISVGADNPEMKPIAALMLNLALGVVTEKKGKHPLMLLLDEFTNFGYIRGFPSKLTIMRHDKIPVVLGVQDLIQLDNTYGPEAKMLRSQPSTRIFFKPNDPDTAVVLSKALGEYTREESTVTSTGQIHKTKDRKMLMSADELLNLGAVDHDSANDFDRPTFIAFLPKTRPILLPAQGWRDYEYETNWKEFPYPKNPVRAVNDELVIRKDRVQDDDQELIQQPQTLVDELQPAKDPIDNFISQMRNQSLDSDTWQFPKMWYEPVFGAYKVGENRVEFRLTPESTILEMELIIAAYEDGDSVIRALVTEIQYNKIAAWWERAALRAERDRWAQPKSEPASPTAAPVSKWEQMAQEEMEHPSERRELPNFPQWEPTPEPQLSSEIATLESPNVASTTVERLEEEKQISVTTIEESEVQRLIPMEQESQVEEDFEEELGYGGAWD